MRNGLTKTLIMLGLAALPLPLLAHHPFSSEFDANKPVTLTGTVTSVEWKAPHVNVMMEAKDDTGKTVSWKLEGATPGTLQKHGWKSTTLQKGSQITAMAYRALDGSNTVSARSVTLPDGRT